MNVLFVNRFFWPDDTGTGQMAADLAEDLRAAGHGVSVICSDAGVHAPGWRLPRIEEWEGISIRRVRSGRFDRSSKVGWLLNALLFYPALVWRLLWSERVECLVFMSDPPMLYVLGPVFGLLKRCRCVYWSQDLYPDVAIAAGAISGGSVVGRLCSWVGGMALRRYSLVIAIGERMKERIVRYGVAESRVVVCPNWTDGSRVRSVPRAENSFLKEHGLESSFVVLYSGNLGLSHEFSTILDAAWKFQDPSIVFLFIGAGKQLAAVKELAGRLTNVRFLPFQRVSRLSESLSAGDCHIVTLKPGMEGTLLPSKLYSALACGRPVLFVGPESSEPAAVLESGKCGSTIAPGDADGLAARIRELHADRGRLAEMGSAALAEFRKSYARPVGTARVIAALRSGHPS